MVRNYHETRPTHGPNGRWQLLYGYCLFLWNRKQNSLTAHWHCDASKSNGVKMPSACRSTPLRPPLKPPRHVGCLSPCMSAYNYKGTHMLRGSHTITVTPNEQHCPE